MGWDLTLVWLDLFLFFKSLNIMSLLYFIIRPRCYFTFINFCIVMSVKIFIIQPKHQTLQIFYSLPCGVWESVRKSLSCLIRLGYYLLRSENTERHKKKKKFLKRLVDESVKLTNARRLIMLLTLLCFVYTDYLLLREYSDRCRSF